MQSDRRILIAEDVPTDAELAARELKNVLKKITVRVVDNLQDFRRNLKTFKPELIISDYQMPSFTGIEALELSHRNDPFVPFIVLTGSMNEDTAVECIKAGADDYVIKEHIKRLGPAHLVPLKRSRLTVKGPVHKLN